MPLRFTFSTSRGGGPADIRAYTSNGDGRELLVEADRFQPFSRKARRAFCERVAELLVKAGHDVPAGEVETRFLEALADHEAGQGEGATENIVETPCWIAGDGRVAEQVYDPGTGRVAFVATDSGGPLQITKNLQDGERTILPVGGGQADAFVRTGAVKLPTAAVTQIKPPSTAEVLQAIRRHITRYVGLRPGDLLPASYSMRFRI